MKFQQGIYDVHHTTSAACTLKIEISSRGSFIWYNVLTLVSISGRKPARESRSNSSYRMRSTTSIRRAANCEYCFAWLTFNWAIFWTEGEYSGSLWARSTPVSWHYQPTAKPSSPAKNCHLSFLLRDKNKNRHTLQLPLSRLPLHLGCRSTVSCSHSKPIFCEPKGKLVSSTNGNWSRGLLLTAFERFKKVTFGVVKLKGSKKKGLWWEAILSEHFWMLNGIGLDLKSDVQ